MNIVRQHINEKFSVDSDPIHDMGIGYPVIYQNLKVGDVLQIKKFINDGFPSVNSYLLITKIERYPKEEYNVRLTVKVYYTLEKLKTKIADHIMHSWGFTYEFFKEYFTYLGDIDDLKESLNEKFKLDSDPIRDMGIGNVKLIKDWLYSNRNNISDYKINDNLTIDARHISFYRTPIGNLPEYIQFNHVSGGITFFDCGLTTMRGFPYTMEGCLSIGKNKLTSFKFCPKGYFAITAWGNKLKSLKGIPQKVDDNFHISTNMSLKSLNYMPKEIKKDFVVFNTGMSEEYIKTYIYNNKIKIGGKKIITVNQAKHEGYDTSIP